VAACQPSSVRLPIAFALIVVSGWLPARGAAQGSSIADGDLHRQHREIPAALKAYERAIALNDTSYEALWRASDVAVVLGEFASPRARRDSLYDVGERYARRAVAANPGGAHGHFVLAQALGRKALTVSLLDRARYAMEIRDHALAAIRIDPRHAPAHHVIGMWHQNVMQLSWIQRRGLWVYFKGRINASWDDAQKSLERAAELEPTRIVHRIDLARIYLDRDQRAKAREQLEWIRRAPEVEYNDANYRREALELVRAVIPSEALELVRPWGSQPRLSIGR
jgi:tetratricopeptide (TPR) repeat protein